MKASSKPTNKRCCLKTEVPKMHTHTPPHPVEMRQFIKTWMYLLVLAAVLDASGLSDCAEKKHDHQQLARTGEGSSVSRRHLHFWNAPPPPFFWTSCLTSGLKWFENVKIVHVKACFRLHLPPLCSAHRSTPVGGPTLAAAPSSFPHGRKAGGGSFWDHEWSKSAVQRVCIRLFTSCIPSQVTSMPKPTNDIGKLKSEKVVPSYSQLPQSAAKHKFGQMDMKLNS